MSFSRISALLNAPTYSQQKFHTLSLNLESFTNTWESIDTDKLRFISILFYQRIELIHILIQPFLMLRQIEARLTSVTDTNIIQYSIFFIIRTQTLSREFRIFCHNPSNLFRCQHTSTQNQTVPRRVMYLTYPSSCPSNEYPLNKDASV